MTDSRDPEGDAADLLALSQKGGEPPLPTLPTAPVKINLASFSNDALLARIDKALEGIDPKAEAARLEFGVAKVDGKIEGRVVFAIRIGDGWEGMTEFRAKGKRDWSLQAGVQKTWGPS